MNSLYLLLICSGQMSASFLASIKNFTVSTRNKWTASMRFVRKLNSILCYCMLVAFSATSFFCERNQPALRVSHIFNFDSISYYSVAMMCVCVFFLLIWVRNFVRANSCLTRSNIRIPSGHYLQVRINHFTIKSLQCLGSIRGKKMLSIKRN